MSVVIRRIQERTANNLHDKLARYNRTFLENNFKMTKGSNKENSPADKTLIDISLLQTIIVRYQKIIELQSLESDDNNAFAENEYQNSFDDISPEDILKPYKSTVASELDELRELLRVPKQKNKISPCDNAYEMLKKFNIERLRREYELGLQDIILNPQIRLVYVDYFFDILQREIYSILEMYETAKSFSKDASAENGYVVPELSLRNIQASIFNATNEAAYVELAKLGEIASTEVAAPEKTWQSIAECYKAQMAFINDVFAYITNLSNNPVANQDDEPAYQKLKNKKVAVEKGKKSSNSISLDHIITFVKAGFIGQTYVKPSLPYEFSLAIFAAFAEKMSELRPKLMNARKKL